jgi:hypothetical protein
MRSRKLAVIVFAAAAVVAAGGTGFGEGPEYETTGNSFLCDTLSGLRRIPRVMPERVPGCDTFEKGLPADLLERGTDYVKIRVRPRDEPVQIFYADLYAIRRVNR